MLLGVHVSIAGSIDKAVDRAKEMDCTTFQIFTRNPRGWKFSPLNQEEVDAFVKKLKVHGYKLSAAHMPYLPNISSPFDETYEKSLEVLKAELSRCGQLKINYLVTHLGSHLGKGLDIGLKRVINACNQALSSVSNDAMLLLEITSGAKNSVGYEFEHIKSIIDKIEQKDRVGVCFDTCLPPGSPIFSNGRPRPIEEIVPCDTIIGMDGSPDDVVAILKRRYSGSLVRVKPAGLPWIRVTPEHPILCLSLRGLRHLDSRPWRIKLLDPPRWIYASDVRPGYYLIMPKLKLHEVDAIDFRPYIGPATRRPPFSTTMWLTNELAELLGLYLAEGFTFMGLSNDGSERGKVYLAFGHHEKKLVERTSRLIEDIFSLRTWIDENGSATKVCVGSNILARFLSDNFGSNSREKMIPSFILHASPYLIKAFLWGYLAGDGCNDQSGLRFTTASETVAYQLIHLLAKVDIRGTLHEHGPTRGSIEGRPVASPGWYEVRVGRADASKLEFYYELRVSASRMILRDEQYFYIPVKAVEAEPYEGVVYNLTTRSGTFIAPFIVTHNCHAFAAGYDLRNEKAVNETLRLFNKIIGLSKLKVVHLNDSKGKLGSHLDRHEHIGLGFIGEEGFRAIINHKAIRELPLILETPVDSERDWLGNLKKVRELYE